MSALDTLIATSTQLRDAHAAFAESLRVAIDEIHSAPNRFGAAEALQALQDLRRAEKAEAVDASQRAARVEELVRKVF